MDRSSSTPARWLTPTRLLAAVAVVQGLGVLDFAILLIIDWRDPVGRILNVSCVALLTLAAAGFSFAAVHLRRRRRRSMIAPTGPAGPD